MVASTDIKFYAHTNTNAPKLTNNFGCMIDVLDACVVNGFDSQVISTLTASDTIVTATFGAAHNLMQYQVIKISGANQSEFNGEHRILEVTTNTIKFQIESTASIGTATGTITCSLPPLGWEKPFGSTATTGGGGKAAYRSKNILLPSRPFLRIIDEKDAVWGSSFAKYAKVGIVEDMADIDTLLGVQAPFDSNSKDKNWIGTRSGSSAFNGWAKWYYARNNSDANIDGSVVVGGSDSAAPANGERAWTIVGSDTFFYILLSTTPTALPVLYGFGSFESYIDVDSANNFLLATVEYVNANASISPTSMKQSAVGTLVNNIIVQRDFLQNEMYTLAGSTSIQIRPGTASIASGSSNYAPASTSLNKMIFAPVFLNENGLLRGKMPSIMWLFQKNPLNNKDCFNHIDNYYLALDLAVQANSTYATSGQILFQLG